MAATRTSILVLLFYWISSVEIWYGNGMKGVMAQDSEVEVTAPLNPVKEGDILSVHCRIERLGTNTVMMYRNKNGKDEQLASGVIITSENDRTRNRMFIAKRLLKDGSQVFFLSVTDVTREDDEATYKCNVMKGADTKEDFGVVHIAVQYFPMEGPTCTSSVSEPIDVPERTEVILNCTSQVGNPPVDVVWIKSGEDTTPVQVKFIRDDVVYSELTLRPTMKDNAGIYQCEVRSSVFREEHQINRCHIGPITVTENPTTPPPTVQTTSPAPVLTTIYRPPDPELTEECREFCRLEQEPTIFYWTIATVVAGILAVVFLVMGIIILIKYCLALSNAKSDRGRGSRGRPEDDVDAGVEFRRDDNRVYMSLDRSGRVQEGQLVYQTRGELVGAQVPAHYILTPTRGDDGERQYIVTPTRDQPGTSQTEAVYQEGVVLERQMIPTPFRGEFERPQYIPAQLRIGGAPVASGGMPPGAGGIPGPGGMPGAGGIPVAGCMPGAGPVPETIEQEQQRQQYIATPVRVEGSDRPQYIATPIRELGGPQSQQYQQYSATPCPGTPKRGEERQHYIATPALAEGERQYIVTPTQGGGLERHYLDTPTLPPRRYRSQYV